MTPYNKPAPFPVPYVPKGEGVVIPDPFGNLLKSVPQANPSNVIVTGGGGGGGTPVTPVVNVELPRHPWKIMITNNYDTSDPPVWVSASAQIYPNSFVYNGMTYASTISISGIGTVFGPTNGTYLYLAGTVTTAGGGGVSGITLLTTTSLPSRVVFSGVNQTQFNAVIGKFLQLADSSFTAEQWIHNNLTIMAMCSSNLGVLYPMEI